MSLQLRPAIRSSAKLLIGLYSESGGGKTLSALLLARGFVGPDAAIAMIETESGRGEVYSDVVPGGYLVRPIVGDFNPKAYGQAITECEQSGAKALVIDSASHEWEGAGGVLSLAADNQAAGKKGPLVWQQPKMSHQRDFVLRLMATPIDIVIICMRAKYPMEERAIEGRDGVPGFLIKKDWVRSDVLHPKQSEDILFEMFIHGWLDKEEHKFHPTKYPTAIKGIEDTIRAGEVITIESGQRLAQWASGRKEPAPPPPSTSSAPSPGATEGAAGLITADQEIELADLLAERRIDKQKLLIVASKAIGREIGSLTNLPMDFYERAKTWIEAH